MSLKILNYMPSASTACYVAVGAIVAGKPLLAAGCKAMSLMTGLLDKQRGAEWDQASQKYLEQTKKQAFRDLTVATGLLAAGFGGSYAVDLFNKEEPGILEKIGNGLYDWSRPIIAVTIANYIRVNYFWGDPIHCLFRSRDYVRSFNLPDGLVAKKPNDNWNFAFQNIFDHTRLPDKSLKAKG